MIAFAVMGAIIFGAIVFTGIWWWRGPTEEEDEEGELVNNPLRRLGATSGSNKEINQPLFPILQPASNAEKYSVCTPRGCVRLIIMGFGVLTLVALIMLTISYVYFSGGRRAPLKVKGLSADTTVEVSKKGMLHITAKTRHDALFTQGLMTAELRLWQMEFQRRVGQGRLAEFVGDKALATDKLMRTLGVYEGAKRSLQHMNADSVSSIDSYVAGVNAYLDSKPTLPLEMQLLGYKEMEPWTAADSLVWSKLMALDLSGNLKFELARLNILLSGASLDRIEELVPPFNTSHFPTVLTMDDITKSADGGPGTNKIDAVSVKRNPALDAFYKGLQADASAHRSKHGDVSNQEPPRHLFLNHGEFGQLFSTKGASNNWVVGPKRSKTGSAMLCNDPHLALTAPSVWITTHLEIEDVGQSLWGASFVGLPGIVIGRNSYIAWGVTNTAVDVQDLYIIDKESDDKTQYNLGGEWVNYDTSKETFKVKGGNPVTIDVRWTKVGPVISDNGVLGPLHSTKTAYKFPIAMQWVATDPSIVDTTFAAFDRINLAKNYTEFREALEGYVAPAQNFVFADREGNFGYQMPGKVPKRAEGHTGKMPVPASGKYRWVPSPDGAAPYQFMPFDDMPRTYNPPRGFVASANNQVCPVGFEKGGYLLSHDWDASMQGYRSKRITEMILGHKLGEAGKAKPLLNTEDMRNIQLDYHSGWYDDFHGLLPELMKYHTELDLTSDAIEQARLMQPNHDPAYFNGNMDVGSIVATKFAKFMIELAKVTDHEIGRGAFFSANYLRKTFMAGGDAACAGALAVLKQKWTVLKGLSKARSACLAYAALKLNKVTDFQAKTAGARWGVDLHMARFTHQILHNSAAKCIADIFVGHGGDSSTVNVGHIDDDDADMVQLEGPSYRQIIQVDELYKESKTSNSRFLGPLGQSGDLFSPHYDDLAKAWSVGDYLRMDTRGQTGNETIVDRRTLSPA
jgi:penicillin amidase